MNWQGNMRGLCALSLYMMFDMEVTAMLIKSYFLAFFMEKVMMGAC